MFLPFGCWAVRLKHLRLACPLFGLMAWEGIAAYLPVMGRYGGIVGLVWGRGGLLLWGRAGLLQK